MYAPNWTVGLLLIHSENTNACEPIIALFSEPYWPIDEKFDGDLDSARLHLTTYRLLVLLAIIPSIRSLHFSVCDLGGPFLFSDAHPGVAASAGVPLVSIFTRHPSPAVGTP